MRTASRRRRSEVTACTEPLSPCRVAITRSLDRMYRTGSPLLQVALTWSLARSLRWGRPQLLLLDEPTHGLSSVNRQRLLAMLSTLAEDAEMALVLVTHRQDEIAQLGFENVLRLEGSGEVGGA